MNEQTVSSSKFNGEIDFKELFRLLWNSKVKIFTITVVFAIGSAVYSVSVPNQYKATTLLAPAQSDGAGLSSAMAQLGGLASLAGVSIGGGESSESQIAQEIMRSWSFVETFIIDNDLAVEVYAAEGWNKRSNKLKINDDIYNVESRQWLLETGDDGELGPPSSWQLFKRFQQMLKVSENKISGLLSVSIEYYSPEIAKEWLDMYVTAINEHMQSRKVAKVSNNINYLEAQIEKTSIAEMREVFYTIIEEQTKNKMVAEASPDYAFVAVSPSMVPEKKSQPKRARIFVLGTLLGGMLSVFVILLSYYARRS